MENQKYITVRSLTLLKALYDEKLTGSMARVVFEKGGDGNTYPVFLFPDKDRVKTCYDKHIEQFGADDRTKDDPALWSGFDAAAIKNHKECKRLNTRNYQVVRRAFEIGQMGNLIGCRYADGRMIFQFVNTDALEAIKAEEDEKSRARWEEKQKQEGGKNEN